MSNKPAAGDDRDAVDDETLFYDDDFEADEFVDTHESDPALTNAQRRLMSLRRVEERRERKWLESQLNDWDDYDDSDD